MCFGVYIYFKYFYLRKKQIIKIDKESIKKCGIILLVVIAFFSTVLIQMKYHFINFTDPKDYSFKILTLSSITYGLLQFGLNSSSASKKIYLGEDIIKYVFLDSRVIKFLFTKTYKLLFLYIVFSAVFYNALNLSPIEDLIVFSKYEEIIIKLGDFMESLWFVAIVFMILLICLTLFKGISFIKIMFTINNNRTRNIEWIITNEKEKELKNNLIESLYIGDLKYFFNTAIFKINGLSSSEKSKYLSFVSNSFDFINDDQFLENIIYYYSLQNYDNKIELFFRFTIREYDNLIHKKSNEIDFLEMDTLFLDLINCFHDFIIRSNYIKKIDSNFIDELIKMYSIIDHILYKICSIVFKKNNEREDFLRKNLYNDINKSRFFSNLYKQNYNNTMSKLLELTSNIDQIKTIFIMLLKSPLCLSSSNHKDSFLDVIENVNRVKDIIGQILQLCECRGYSDQDTIKIFTLNDKLNKYDCGIIDMHILEYCYSWGFKKNYYPLYKLILNKSDYNVKTKFILYLFLEGHRYDKNCDIKLDIEFLRKCMSSTGKHYNLNINSIEDEIKESILSSNIGHRFKESDLDKLINWIVKKISSRNIMEIYNFEGLRFEESLLLKYVLDYTVSVNTLHYDDFECIISLNNSKNKVINTINYFIDDKHSKLLVNKYVLEILFYYGKLFKKLFLKDKSLLYHFQYTCKFYIILNQHFSNNELICMDNEMGFYNSEFIEYIILKFSDDKYNQYLENDKFKNQILDKVYHLISSKNLDVFSYVEKLFDDYSKYSSFIDLTPLAKGKIIRILKKIIH